MPVEQKDIQNREQGRSEVSTYRSIFKATSLFGGVQVYNILIGIVKAKFIAVLLGPAGMGIQGLLSAGINLIKSFTSFGLSTSAIRDVADANGSGDMQKVGRAVAILRRLVWITGLLGLVATAVFSPILSKSSFGNYDYTIPFIALSVILLLNQLSAGQNVVLQGMRKLKFLAKSSAIGATLGLIVSVPLYYLLGVKGIVPTLILNAVTSLCLSWYFSHKVSIPRIEVTTREALHEGLSMIKMGIAMSVSGILGTVFAYLIRGFIRSQGGVEDVGLYTAGFTLMNTYVGMVFTAMATDYYPRLSAVNKDNDRCREVINQQAEIACLIIGPMVVACTLLMPYVVELLYSKEFLPATDFILWAVLGLMFKAASWSISFIFLSKAESRLFIYNETATNTYSFLLKLLCYFFWGLTGLGIAYTVGFMIYLVQVYIVSRKKYNFRFSNEFLKVFIIQMTFALVGYLAIKVWHSSWVNVLVVVMLSFSLWHSLTELNKRMDVVALIKRRRK